MQRKEFNVAVDRSVHASFLNSEAQEEKIQVKTRRRIRRLRPCWTKIEAATIAAGPYLLLLFKMVAMWYCCDCGLLNESTHHNAVYCHCDHHVCGECSHAKRKSSHHHHNHDLHKRFSRGATRHKTKAIHHHHDTRHEMSVQIGANLLAGILVAAITSAACSVM